MSNLYFAFASNIVPEQMEKRCPGAAPLGTAVLADHRFGICGRGYGTVTPEPGASVWGVLWSLTDQHEAALDVYEGVRQGLYRKTWRLVRAADGEEREALVYVAADTVPGAPVPGYLEAIVAAAARHGLPAEYLTELRSWLP